MHVSRCAPHPHFSRSGLRPSLHFPRTICTMHDDSRLRDRFRVAAAANCLDCATARSRHSTSPCRLRTHDLRECTMTLVCVPDFEPRPARNARIARTTRLSVQRSAFILPRFLGCTKSTTARSRHSTLPRSPSRTFDLHDRTMTHFDAPRPAGMPHEMHDRTMHDFALPASPGPSSFGRTICTDARCSSDHSPSAAPLSSLPHARNSKICPQARARIV